MDYETQNAIDSATQDVERKLDDVRWNLEKDIAELRRDLSRLEDKVASVRTNLSED